MCLASLIVVASAGGCTSADYNKWEVNGQAASDSALHKCAMKCHATPTCVALCLQSTENYTPLCAKCFGDIAFCARSHCFLKCIGPGYKLPRCKECVQSQCTDAFNTCTGNIELSARRLVFV